MMFSGLVDGQESVEVAALRELEEETGLKGKVVAAHGITLADPWKSNENGRFAFVEVCLLQNSAF